MRYLIRGAGTLALLVSGSGQVAAQPLWADRVPTSTVEFGLARPIIPDAELGALSGAGQLAGTLRLGARMLVRLELPVARIGGTDSDAAGGTAVGAPYIGLIGENAAGSTRFQIGVRIAPWEAGNLGAVAVGLATDMDRFEAFLPEQVALRGSLQFGRSPSQRMGVQGRIGATVIAPTDGNGADPEALLDYGVRVGRESEHGFVHGDLSGRLLVTESGGSFAERSTHMIGVSGGLHLTGVTPMVEVRLPLEESVADLVVRIGARIRM